MMVENEEKKSELRPMMKISELVPYLKKKNIKFEKNHAQMMDEVGVLIDRYHPDCGSKEFINAYYDAVHNIEIETSQWAEKHTNEFGYVLAGSIFLHLGDKKNKVRKGESFYFKPRANHYISNPGKKEARVVWVSTPPSF